MPLFELLRQRRGIDEDGRPSQHSLMRFAHNDLRRLQKRLPILEINFLQDLELASFWFGNYPRSQIDCPNARAESVIEGDQEFSQPQGNSLVISSRESHITTDGIGSLDMSYLSAGTARLNLSF